MEHMERSELLVGQLANECKQLGRLESREAVLMDIVRETERTAVHLSRQLQQCRKTRSKVQFGIFLAELRALKEGVDFNNRLKRDSVYESKMVQKEILQLREQQNALRLELERRLR
jgi:hypothetical protein